MLNNKLKKFIFKKMIKLAIISIVLFFIIEILFVYYVKYITNTQSLGLAYSMAINSYYHIFVMFILFGFFLAYVSFIVLKAKYKKRAENYITAFSFLIIISFIYFGFSISYRLFEKNNTNAYTQEITPCIAKSNIIECENGYKYIFKSDFKIEERVSLKNTLFIQ